MSSNTDHYIDPEWSGRRLAKATAPLFGLERSLLETYRAMRQHRELLTQHNWLSTRDDALAKLHLLAVEQNLTKVANTLDTVEADNRAILRAASRYAL